MIEKSSDERYKIEKYVTTVCSDGKSCEPLDETDYKTVEQIDQRIAQLQAIIDALNAEKDAINAVIALP